MDFLTSGSNFETDNELWNIRLINQCVNMHETNLCCLKMAQHSGFAKHKLQCNEVNDHIAMCFN